MSERRTRLSFKEKFDIFELSLKPSFDKDGIMKKYRASEQIYIFSHEFDNIALHDKLNPEVSLQKRMTHFFEKKN